MKCYFFLFLSQVIQLFPAFAQENPESILQSMGIVMPQAVEPVANYVTYTRSGNLIFLAGHGPADKEFIGKLGEDLSIEQGYEAARSTGINLLATLKAAIGDLNKVNKILKVTGMVNSAPDFYDQPKVVNGCSDLLIHVFGERGKHARAAVGMSSLPGNIPVEIEMIVEVSE
jgi:enamine deaminase RidA (YjgF/YER057c/UK114 family)